MQLFSKIRGSRLISFRHFRYDLVSGFIVSLIALPLCLGIASASNFPPVTGVLTAITGGLIIGFLSGSELAVKGPAAGLIVIVAGAVEEYGKGDMHQGYLLTASLIAVTGVMQMLLGSFKIGRWADFIPSSIIHGILAAIGIIIISKQAHLLIGITPQELKGMEPLELIKAIPHSLTHLEWHISVTGILCLSLLFILPRVKNPVIKAIPPFLIVIVLSMLVAQALHLSDEKYKFYNPLINPGKLEFNFFFDPGIFSGTNLMITVKYFFLMTIIGTIESILTVKAVDLLDPYKRTSDYDRDVIAVGAGNLLAGLMGALPMISEVARSSANISNKGVTRLSAISHGFFLFAFVLLFAPVIKLIPVAALSSILIFVGLKLANPRDLVKAWKISHEHFLILVTTMITTICIDMLVGVAFGIACKILINFIKSGELKSLFKAKIKTEASDRQCIIYLDTTAVFTNWLPVKKILQREQGKKLVIDFSAVKITDSAFIENVTRYKESYGADCVLRSLQELHPVKDHPYSMRLRNDNGAVLTIRLDARRMELKSFCEENNFVASFTAAVPKNYLSEFRSFRHTDVRQTRIYVSGETSGVRFEYIEALMYDAVDMLEYNANILVADLGPGIPKFMLQRESKLDTVVELLMKSQVSFKDQPLFNSNYSVYSRDKEGALRLLNKDVAAYFESHDLGERVVEGDGGRKVVIYSNGRQAKSAKELENALEIAAVLQTARNLSALPPTEQDVFTRQKN